MDSPELVRATRPQGPLRAGPPRRPAGMTGVDDRYEPPEGADLVVRPAPPGDLAREVLHLLAERGLA